MTARIHTNVRKLSERKLHYTEDFGAETLKCFKKCFGFIVGTIKTWKRNTKELSFCHKLWFSIPNFIATQCRRPLIFQTMNDVISKNVSVKYQRCTSSGCRDTGIKKSEFVAKTKLLYAILIDLQEVAISLLK